MNRYTLQLFAESMSQSEADNKEKQSTEAKVKSSPDGTQESNEEKAGGAQGKLYTDEDVDKLINRKFAEWQAKKDKEADMNAQQRAEYQRDQLQKELDEYKRREKLAEMGKTARSMLAEQDIEVPDELVASLVTEDAETTAANVKAFAKAFTTAVQKAVEGKIAHTEPKAGGAATMTKAEILGIKDPIARQKAISENIGLFKN